MSSRLIARVLLLFAVFSLGICLSALISSWYVAKQLSVAIRARTAESAPLERAVGAPTQEIDFFEATGINLQELREFLRDFAKREHVNTYPAFVTLQNSRGDYLAESRVVVRWNTGEHRLLVGESAVIQFLLEERKLPGLKIIAPKGYVKLRQRSIPLGEAYDPGQKLDLGDVPFDVTYDGHILSAITRGLTRLRLGNQTVPVEEFQGQLRRNHCTLELPPPHDTQLSAEEIYQLNRDSVVIIVHVYPDGSTSKASGFVLDPAGVIATNYHVVDKPTAIARGVLTAANRMYAVTQVLAADKSGDVALLEIDATDLKPVRLGPAAPVGASLTLISHPNSRFYSLTQGSTSRYWAAVSYGRETLRMGITAEFAGGSSGAPLFDTRGNVVVASER